MLESLMSSLGSPGLLGGLIANPGLFGFSGYLTDPDMILSALKFSQSALESCYDRKVTCSNSDLLRRFLICERWMSRGRLMSCKQLNGYELSML